jgi:hypothetical protein
MYFNPTTSHLKLAAVAHFRGAMALMNSFVILLAWVVATDFYGLLRKKIMMDRPNSLPLTASVMRFFPSVVFERSRRRRGKSVIN